MQGTGIQKLKCNHLETIMSPFCRNIQNPKCEICDKQFKRKDHLKRHIRAVHEKKRPHKCSVCGASFSHKANMKSHIAIVHKEEKD